MLKSELLTSKYDTQHEQRRYHHAKKQYEDMLRVAQEQTALIKQYKATMHKTPEQVEQQIPAIDTYKEVEQAPPPPAKVTSDASPKQWLHQPTQDINTTSNTKQSKIPKEQVTHASHSYEQPATKMMNPNSNQ